MVPILHTPTHISRDTQTPSLYVAAACPRSTLAPCYYLQQEPSELDIPRVTHDAMIFDIQWIKTCDTDTYVLH